MNALTGVIVGLKMLAGVGQTELAQPAWALLKAARLDEAADAAREALREVDSPDLHHILFNVAYLQGNYEAALEHFEQIPPGYPRIAAIDEAAIHAYRQLGRHRDALDLARELKRPAGELALLEHLAVTPFAATLENVAVIPFADHPLTPYFPAFAAFVNGHDVVTHIDTGGNYLLMGPERAKALGIEVREAGRGYHGANSVPKSVGVAESFRLGDATFLNVPVTVLATLSGQQDFIIFGTNILEPFLSTLDYPNARLVLSPRGNDALAREHRAMFPDRGREVPFLLWSDHYMLARGALGDATGWFFVDSGLVMIHEWQGVAKQAAFLASKAQLKSLGVDDRRVKNSPFELPAAIGLDGLPQVGHIAVVGDACPKDFGDVEMHGLLSHAYLKQYAWTIDFDRRVFIFCGAAPSAR